MDKHQVAEILVEIGTLLELKGENPFKTRAYQNAARTIETLSEPLDKMVAEGRLGELKGIGEALQQKITDLVIMYLWGQKKSNLELEGIEIVDISIGGEAEDPGRLVDAGVDLLAVILDEDRVAVVVRDVGLLRVLRQKRNSGQDKNRKE